MSATKRTSRRPSAWARVLLASAGVLAGGSCSLLESDDCCWLTITPIEWTVYDSLSAFNSSLLDSAGLAGIEIRVLGKVFTADDFKQSTTGRATVWPRLAVGESGAHSAWVRLVQDGREAAVGTISWMPRENTDWILRVERTSHPSFLQLYDEELCLLGVNECRYKRLPIVAELANYPEELLWLVLLNYPHKVPDGAIR